jgi:hypothetical protein
VCPATTKDKEACGLSGNISIQLLECDLFSLNILRIDFTVVIVSGTCHFHFLCEKTKEKFATRQLYLLMFVQTDLPIIFC